ncbi:MAG: ferredoxin-type protein NapH, partial [Flavobacteriales bacterium]
MKGIKHTGLALFVIGLMVFTASTFLGSFSLNESIIQDNLDKQKYENIGQDLGVLVGAEYTNPIALGNAIAEVYEVKNEELKASQQWDKVMYDSPQSVAFSLVKASAKGTFVESPWLWFFLTFGLAIIGGLAFVLPDMVLLGRPGIKNDKIYQNPVTNKGWIAWFTFVYLVGFYILLYFFPSSITNQILLLNPISESLSGNPASQWFLYGFMYCSVMTVMAVRMFVKYRNNKYQVVRTASVLFFQIVFAFIIPEILVRFNQPYMDFKSAWPLDYDFFFDWNINSLIANGGLGIFMLVWGIVLTLIIVPVLSYIYGKRWYCSWVCGCGGLAETLGDPYRQHSSKTVKSWKVERYLIHGVLVFAVVMTGGALYTFFSGETSLFGIQTYTLQRYYGFLIGS